MKMKAGERLSTWRQRKRKAGERSGIDNESKNMARKSRYQAK
jgi:hypothetical protein